MEGEQMAEETRGNRPAQGRTPRAVTGGAAPRGGEGTHGARPRSVATPPPPPPRNRPGGGGGEGKAD